MGRDVEEKLSVSVSSRYRAVAARAHYVQVGGPDLQLNVKEACRKMAAPDASDLRWVSRIARYLQMVPRVLKPTGAESKAESAIST